MQKWSYPESTDMSLPNMWILQVYFSVVRNFRKCTENLFKMSFFIAFVGSIS